MYIYKKKYYYRQTQVRVAFTILPCCAVAVVNQSAGESGMLLEAGEKLEIIFIKKKKTYDNK